MLAHEGREGKVSVPGRTWVSTHEFGVSCLPSRGGVQRLNAQSSVSVDLAISRIARLAEGATSLFEDLIARTTVSCVGR